MLRFGRKLGGTLPQNVQASWCFCTSCD